MARQIEALPKPLAAFDKSEPGGMVCLGVNIGEPTLIERWTLDHSQVAMVLFVLFRAAEMHS